MLDRRGFLTAMLGAAIMPKDVLSGIASPAPVKKAIEAWICIWKQTGTAVLADGFTEAWVVTFDVPTEVAHLFKVEVEDGNLKVSSK